VRLHRDRKISKKAENFADFDAKNFDDVNKDACKMEHKNSK